MSGVGQLSRFLSFLSQWLPWRLLPLTQGRFQTEAQAQATLARVVDRWAEPDRRSFLQPGVKQLMAASLVEAMRQGARGPAYDGMLLGRRSWGFKLEEITFPAIYLWHGELDQNIPIATVQTLARRIPH